MSAKYKVLEKVPNPHMHSGGSIYTILCTTHGRFTQGHHPTYHGLFSPICIHCKNEREHLRIRRVTNLKRELRKKKFIYSTS